jgi:hypothetical protein
MQRADSYAAFRVKDRRTRHQVEIYMPACGAMYCLLPELLARHYQQISQGIASFDLQILRPAEACMRHCVVLQERLVRQGQHPRGGSRPGRRKHRQMVALIAAGELLYAC